MSDHVERMKDEYKELCDKTKKLNSFIHGNPKFKELDDVEQSRMIKQAGFMESYANILESRIWCAK